MWPRQHPDLPSRAEAIRRLVQRGMSAPEKSVRKRQIVLLRDVDELTIDEIAQSLSLSRETVKGRLHRARGLIREYLTG
jgi:RNA polymerase sigma factor (sigma-70 family)